MAIIYPENDATAPWCGCGCLCDGTADPKGRRGWCCECEDWATEFLLDVEGQTTGLLRRYDPGTAGFRDWDPRKGRWLKGWAVTTSRASG